MIYTEKIERAIDVAIAAHSSQRRKEGDRPYIIHPLSVGIILSRLGVDEDLVAAGILHDVIEDTPVTLGQIDAQFGGRVAGIVDELTIKGDGLSHDDKKRIQIDRIKDMSEDAMLVRSADALHNMHDMLRCCLKMGDSWFELYGRPKESTFGFYSVRIGELKRVWPANPLLPELQDVMVKLLEL